MRNAIVISLTFSLVTTAAGIARADAPKASADTSWLGFNSKKPKRSAGYTPVSNSGASKTPTVVTKVSDGTKRLMGNTKNMFSPKKKAPQKLTGTTGVYSMHPKQEEPGFFHKLFHPEPPPPPRTIDEWMSLKQVHP